MPDLVSNDSSVSKLARSDHNAPAAHVLNRVHLAVWFFIAAEHYHIYMVWQWIVQHCGVSEWLAARGVLRPDESACPRTRAGVHRAAAIVRVPAGCFHLVYNRHACVKLARETCSEREVPLAGIGRQLLRNVRIKHALDEPEMVQGEAANLQVTHGPHGER